MKATPITAQTGRTIPPSAITQPIPRCEDCDHCIVDRDPYATGDWWYAGLECTANFCPYGKLEIDQE